MSFLSSGGAGNGAVRRVRFDNTAIIFAIREDGNMIIGTFNTDNTDPKKAVPSLDTVWVPDFYGNDKAPEDERAYIVGRYLRAGESMTYQKRDASGDIMQNGWDFVAVFLATVKEMHNFFWIDAKTGTRHELKKEDVVHLPVSTEDRMFGDLVVYGWFNHLMNGERLTGDEVKNSGSDSKPSA